jgi:enoyl-CoA hydratase/carnithine racemase
MDLCLTARMMDATEAERAGLVSRIVPADKLVDEARGRGRDYRRLLAAGCHDDQGVGERCL